MTTELFPRDIEFIRILAGSDDAAILAAVNHASRQGLDRAGAVLRQYHRENTMNAGTCWTLKLERAGITKDDGKAAIACARRLGMDIS